MNNLISLKINGKIYKSQKNKTILQVCGENGIYIPTLCYAPIFPPQSNCRICLVEVKNRRSLLTACSVFAEEGMGVYTDTEKVENARTTNLKLLFSDHIGKCPSCVRFDNCELLKLVIKYHGSGLEFKGKERKIPIDKSGVVTFDLNKCIKCRRCIHACKTYGSDVLALSGKGFHTRISTKNGKKIKDSGCIGCKKCAEVCPVGSIYIA